MMNRFSSRQWASSLLIAGFATALAPIYGQSPASLALEMQVERNNRIDEDKTVEMTIVSDGEDLIGMIMATEDGVVRTIFDGPANTMTTVTPDDDGTQVMIVPVPKIRQRDLVDYAGDVEQTDETKEILGHTATKYILTQDGEVTEAWVATIPGLTYDDLFGKLRDRGGERTIPRLPEMRDAITLESHTTSRNGRKVYHTYARSLATGGDVDLSVFEIPADAEVMDMTSLRGMLGG